MRVADKHAGRLIRCPKCNGIAKVPQAESPSTQTDASGIAGQWFEEKKPARPATTTPETPAPPAATSSADVELVSNTRLLCLSISFFALLGLTAFNFSLGVRPGTLSFQSRQSNGGPQSPPRSSSQVSSSQNKSTQGSSAQSIFASKIGGTEEGNEEGIDSSGQSPQVAMNDAPPRADSGPSDGGDSGPEAEKAPASIGDTTDPGVAGEMNVPEGLANPEVSYEAASSCVATLRMRNPAAIAYAWSPDGGSTFVTLPVCLKHARTSGGGAVELNLDGRKFAADVVRKHEQYVLLRPEQVVETPRLILGSCDSLGPTSVVSVAKNGSGEFEKRDVTSLRTSNGKLELVQFDGAFAENNAGLPVISDAGEVIGMSLGGLYGTELNFFRPITGIEEKLPPHLRIKADTLQDISCTSPKELHFEVSNSDGNFSVEYTLNIDGAAGETLRTDVEDSAFNVFVPPLNESHSFHPTATEVVATLDAVLLKDGLRVDSRKVTTMLKIRPPLVPRISYHSPVKRDVGERIRDVFVGGYGRWVGVHVESTNSVLVYDVVSAIQVGRIDLPTTDDEPVLTAGREHFYIYLPKARTLQKCTLDSCEIVRQRIFDKAQISELAMGCGSAGPLIARNGDGWSQINVESMAITALEMPFDLTGRVRVLAATDGRSFTVRKVVDSEYTSYVYLPHAPQNQISTKHSGYLKPAFDSRFFYAGNRIYKLSADFELEPVKPDVPEERYPARHGAYFGFSGTHDLFTGHLNRKDQVLVPKDDTHSPIMKLRFIERRNGSARMHDPGQLFHLVPDAGVIVVLSVEGGITFAPHDFEAVR